MSTKKYRVILTSRSALKITTRQSWEGSDYHLTIKDDFKETSDKDCPEHLGLIYTVEIVAERIKDSITKAMSLSRHITDQIAFVHGLAIDYPLPRFSIDIDPAYDYRELAQVLYNVPVLQNARRVFDKNSYGSFFDLFDALRQHKPKDAVRIDRALHYLRKSYLEKEPIDGFEDAWVALEAINPLIQRKYKTSTTYQRKCPRCKEYLFCHKCNSAIKNSDTASGIVYIITDILGETSDVASKLRKKRIDIFHSRSSLSKVLTDINYCTQIAQRAVVAGIYDILGVPKEDILQLLRNTLCIVDAPSVTVKAILYDSPVEKLANLTKYPNLYLRNVLLGKKATNYKEAHWGGARPIVASLNIGIKDFSGHWELCEVYSLIEVDPEEDAPEIQIITQKYVSPNIGT